MPFTVQFVLSGERMTDAARSERVARARREGRLGADAERLQRLLDERGVSLAEGLADDDVRRLNEAVTARLARALPAERTARRAAPPADDDDFYENFQAAYKLSDLGW